MWAKQLPVCDCCRVWLCIAKPNVMPTLPPRLDIRPATSATRPHGFKRAYMRHRQGQGG
jgi:hypothetical protein